jgi:orotate phosphoribosyltransferase
MAPPNAAQPSSLAAGERDELREIIRRRSVRTGDFTLASGRKSDFYCNLKPTMMDPRGAHLAGRAFLEVAVRLGADFVGGLEMGAVPLIAGMAAISDIERRPVRTFFVRKQAKAHGTREVVEGLGADESLSGTTAVVADDVATTGGSILQAVEAARAAGATVTDALVLVDREEGAGERLAAHGVRLHSVFRAAELR